MYPSTADAPSRGASAVYDRQQDVYGYAEGLGLPTPSSHGDASDAALARRAGMGDTEAFAELFARHFLSTFRYAVHMLDGDDDLAADAVQETWVAVWRNLSGFRNESQLLTWIFAIVSRKVLDARVRRRPVTVDDGLLEGRAAPAAEADPHHHLVNLELWESLSLALTELPWRQKAVWLLRELEGMSYSEIARVLDTTPSVVRGQLHRARRALASRMEQWR